MANPASSESPDRPAGPSGVFGRLVGSVVSPIVGNIDLDEVIDQIDVNEAVERIDINQLVDRVDVDRLLGRIDVDELVNRVDLDQAIQVIDINQLLDRIDPDRLLDRIDPDRLLERVDVNQLVARTELGEIIARSTTGVFAELLDVARTQVIIADQVVQGVPARILRRAARQLPPHPGGPEEPAGSANLSPTDRAVQMQGRCAGSLSRFLAFLVDQFVIGVFFAVGALLGQSAIRVIFQSSFNIEDSGPAAVIAFAMWSFLYTAGSLAATGRTIGKAILGLMAVRSDGALLDARHAALRTLMFPLSFLLLGIGFLIGLIRPDRRELHDLIADTSIVYAWDADTARRRAHAGAYDSETGPIPLTRRPRT